IAIDIADQHAADFDFRRRFAVTVNLIQDAAAHDGLKTFASIFHALERAKRILRRVDARDVQIDRSRLAHVNSSASAARGPRTFGASPESSRPMLRPCPRAMRISIAGTPISDSGRLMNGASPRM